MPLAEQSNKEREKQVTSLKQPNIIPVKESGELYELAETFKIDIRRFGGKKNLTIPKGFRYDGASVPRWLWSITGLSRDGIHRVAALVHDFLYENRGFQENEKHEYWLSRKEVDDVFREMLIELGVADHRVFIAYWGARAFGRLYWNDLID